MLDSTKAQGRTKQILDCQTYFSPHWRDIVKLYKQFFLHASLSISFTFYNNSIISLPSLFCLLLMLYIMAPLVKCELWSLWAICAVCCCLRLHSQLFKLKQEHLMHKKKKSCSLFLSETLCIVECRVICAQIKCITKTLSSVLVNYKHCGDS